MRCKDCYQEWWDVGRKRICTANWPPRNEIVCSAMLEAIDKTSLTLRWGGPKWSGHGLVSILAVTMSLTEIQLLCIRSHLSGEHLLRAMINDLMLLSLHVESIGVKIYSILGASSIICSLLHSICLCWQTCQERSLPHLLWMMAGISMKSWFLWACFHYLYQ